MAKQLDPQKSIPQETELYETQSLRSAAFCLCVGLKLYDMDRREGSMITFIFEGKDAAKKASGFFNGAKVEARKYSDCLSVLKEQIFKR